MPHRKILLVFLLAVLALALAFLGFGSNPAPDHAPIAKQMQEDSAAWFKMERDLSTLAGDLKAARISAVGISPDYALVSLAEGGQYYVRISGQREMLSAVLAAHLGQAGFQVLSLDDVQPPMHAAAKALRLLSNPQMFQVLLLLLVVGVVILPFTSLMDRNGRMFEMEKKPRTRFRDVVGVQEAKMSLGDICSYLTGPARFVSLGAKPPRGVLLEGPPGTGKTMLARALAGECGANFIALSGSDFSDKFVGVGISRVRRLFARARKHAPCVVFIDEIDGLGRRTSSGMPTETENNRIINAMLVELDGFNATEGVIVVGATNNADSIDPALLREGRFDRSCYLGLPNLEERAELYALYAEKIALDAKDAHGRQELFRQLARLSVGLSPAAIASIVNTAAVEAVKREAASVTLAHLLEALELKRIGSPMEGRQKALSDAERDRIAVHEAGHAVIARLLEVGIVEKVTIIPRGRALGVTLVTKNADQVLQTEHELQNRIEMLLGGRAAEDLILGVTSTGAAQDLEQASQLAFQMVSAHGFSKKLGPFSYAALPDAEKYAGTHENVLSEARELLAEADRRCRERLEQHRAGLESLIAALRERETVPGSFVEECLREPAGRAPAVAPILEPQFA